MAIAFLDQWLLLVASCSFLVILLILKYKLRTRKKLNLPPSPRKLPFIGNLHQLGNMPHLSLRSLAHKYGSMFYLQLGQIPTVVVSSAKIAKELAKTHDLAISGRPQTFGAKCFFYDCTDVAFSPYSAYWRSIRKICIKKLLSVKRVQSFSSIREEEVARLVGRIAGEFPGKVNLSKFLRLYANDTICRMALGRDFSEGGDYDRHGFKYMLEEFQELLGGFSIGEFFPSFQFVHGLSGMTSRIQRTFRRFDQLYDEVIEEHLNSNGEKEHKDLVDVLLDIHKSGSDDGIPLTMGNVKANIMVMFAGGSDTTFITLDWAMTELLMNPKSIEKAQAEVRNVVGDNRRAVQESDLPSLLYLKAVIKETLRLHPAAPMLVPRESIEDIKICEYDIPAKTRIYINGWAIGRDPASWKNSEIFEPERFLGSNVDFKGQDFELIPFGFGRRICPGIAFGLANIELALAQLIHSFDWELPNGISPKDLDLCYCKCCVLARINMCWITTRSCRQLGVLFPHGVGFCV